MLEFKFGDVQVFSTVFQDMLYRQRVGQSESERSYVSFLYKSHKVHKHSKGKKHIKTV